MDKEIGLRQFAKSIGRDPSLLSRWETGDRMAPPTEVAQILGMLGVTGKRYDEIIELAYGTDDPRWFASTVPEQRAQLAALLDFERAATVITDVSPLLIPGLSQTNDYARAIMVAAGVPAGEISTRVAVRMGRRDALTRREPARFVALIGEAALRQRVGTRQIMAEQLGFLLELAAWPNVELRVVPFDSGWHPALEGPALLIESAAEGSVAHLEVRGSGLFLHTRQDVAYYRKGADTIAERAIDAEGSLAVIALAKAEWESA